MNVLFFLRFYPLPKKKAETCCFLLKTPNKDEERWVGRSTPGWSKISSVLFLDFNPISWHSIDCI